MGWSGGSELAAVVWKAVRFLVPAGASRMIAARKIIYEFEQCDCDTILEASELCEDAGYVYDESRDEHVYTPLPGEKCNSLCDIGVPCCECPKAPTSFLYMTSAARATERELYLACARAALTPASRAHYMALADNADPAVQAPAKQASYGREPGGRPIDWQHPPQEIENVGNLLAAEVLRRAIGIKPEETP
jgi:hypothetical protein